MVDKKDWTAPWTAKKLGECESVSGVSIVGPGLLEIERRELPTFTVATLSAVCLDHELLRRTLDSVPQPDFVINLQSDAVLTTEALHLSLDEHVPVGRMSNLLGALSMANVREYVEPETRFRERGLEQHSRVAGFERLDLFRYRIERHGLPSLIAIFLNDYELGAEAIRQARADYGAFDIVVISNPNGSTTNSATAVAEQMGCEVHKWRGFLSRLHRER